MLKMETNAVRAASLFFDVSSRTMVKTFVHSANKTIASSRAFFIKALGEQGIKRKNVVNRFIIDKASSKILSADLRSDDRGIPLSAMSPKTQIVKTARGNRKGVSVLINGERTLVPNAFLVTMKNGHKGIFVRKGDSRLPIKQVRGQKLSSLIESVSGLAESGKAFARDTFFKNFKTDFEFYKGKEKGIAP